ncbi:MAG: Ig-like domain-containing protein [Bacteroidales bacterium]|nr:Ig-like domain-containing protein [Bacteroidales bacterium]
MRLKHLLPLFALAAGMNAGCVPPEGDTYANKETEDNLTVSPTAKKIAEDGTATFAFTLSVVFPGGREVNFENNTATLSFSATGGSVSPSSATTDADGKVTVTFTATDAKSFTGGTVTGVVKKVEGKDLFQQGNLATATAQVLPLDAEEPPVVVDEPIKKAEALKDNTYSIQKKGGDAQVFDFPPEYSQWYVGPGYMDGTKQVIHIELMDEDPEQMTMGWLSGEIPLEVANKLITINQEFYTKYPWAGAKLGTMRLGQDNMIEAHLGLGGNVKPDSSSQFYLKEKGGTKAYSGQYQYLAVFEFENQIWDQETETYLPGDEYTLCINATLEELVADLDYFSLDYPSNWIAPGQSITLSAYWTAGASFDWSNVKLDSQSCNGQSGEWFSWDSSTQKLTAVKSADNQQVKLTFSYSGTDLTDSFSIYNGPGYTSFSFGLEYGSSDYILAENEPADGWSTDTVWLQGEDWTPNDYSFNAHSIEIDPATENYDKVDYNSYGPYVSFRKGIPEGNFNIIFRSKADHGVRYTMPVKVVHHKATSFQITYKHSNGAFEPWTSGGENGVCNYGMGMEVGVITVPEDAYWNWADVELAYDYDGFSFSGHGGKEDHPKLQRTKSNPGGDTSYGTQVIFRLKWDNRKRSEIYVDHN